MKDAFMEGSGLSVMRGFTLVELLVVLSLTTMLSLYMLLNLKEFSRPSNNAAYTMAAFFKEVRQRAMVSTKAYLVQPVGADRVRVSYASVCSSDLASFVLDSSLELRIKSPARMTNTTWSTCYSSRGLADNSIDVPINDGSSNRVVQVVLGGAVRVQ